MEDILFKDWKSIKEVALCSLSAFLTVFILVRLSGKRTLAKLTAFDFIVTVTLGSTLSSMILFKTTIAEGTLALLIIVFLQYLMAWLARSFKTMEKIFNSQPTLLFYDGQFLEKAMQREGITEEEIYAEVRLYRLENLDEVKAIVLELNGEISVIKKSSHLMNKSSLKPVQKK